MNVCTDTLKSPTIMLAKDYKDGAVDYPVMVSEKLDGVPVRIEWEEFSGELVAITRQGKFITSIPHILKQLEEILEPWERVIGELWIPRTPFEVISGKVRGKDPAPDLHLYLYDMVGLNDAEFYKDRYLKLNEITDIVLTHYEGRTAVHAIQHWFCESSNELDYFKTLVYDASTAHQFEGWVVRAYTGKHSQYKLARSWGMQRIVPKPTKDFEVVRVNEAYDSDKNSKGIAGSLDVQTASGEQLRVGAGKASHAMRKEWLDNPFSIVGKIVQVQYKPSSYNALRQPTFQRIREDKETPDNG